MATIIQQNAKKAKKDEFYTQLVDVENELRHYKRHFKGKVVLCNCDDPYESNFFKYFALNFQHLGLKKLIATCYATSPVIGQQLSLFDVQTVDVKIEDGKMPYKIEISEVEDTNGDGAINLADAEELKAYFEAVFEWVTSVFTNTSKARRKLMCGLEWGLYFNQYSQSGLEGKAEEFEAQIAYYLASDDIEKKNGGIYKYLLTGKEKFLSVRAFSPSDRQWAYQKQHGHCPHCLEKGDDAVYEIDEMQADHIIPWSRGGKTVRENCQMLCNHHNNLKSDH